MNTGFQGDTLRHRDRDFELLDQPLELYFDLIGSRPSFEGAADNSRGYAATWVIHDGWLFLEGMAAHWHVDRPMRLNDLFPFAGAHVFAAWFNGQLRGYRHDRGLPDISTGEEVRYPDLTLTIEHGRIASSAFIDRRNVIAPSSAQQSAERSATVIDLAEYRRAGINATWPEVMV